MKYNYNYAGNIVRKETYVEGEEITKGKAVEETVYDNKGNVTKAFTYNTLDSSSKFYSSETEYDETGKTLANYDETGKVVSKTIFHIGNTKTYGYNYDEYNGEAYPDNRINEIRLPNDAVVEYSYDVYSRILSRKISACPNYQITENYTYLRGGNCLNGGCRDRETNYVSSIFCQPMGKQVK